MEAPQLRVTCRDLRIDPNQPMAAEDGENRLALTRTETLFGEQLLPGDRGVVDPETITLENRCEAPRVEVVDEDVGIYEEADSCHRRISSRNASSGFRVEPRPR